MEPANLTPSPREDDRLAALLREPAPELPDDGFSARVLAALPAPAAPGAWRKIALCLTGAVVGVGVALANGASWSGLSAAVDQTEPTFIHLLAFFSDPQFMFALIVTGLSLLFVVLFDRLDPRRL